MLMEVNPRSNTNQAASWHQIQLGRMQDFIAVLLRQSNPFCFGGPMKDSRKIAKPFVFELGLIRDGGSDIVWLSENNGQCLLAFTYQRGQEENNEI